GHARAATKRRAHWHAGVELRVRGSRTNVSERVRLPAPPRPRPRARHGRRARGAPIVPLALDAIPRATYRVQLHSEFRFADVTALVPYLAALGISHVYCSPYLRARPGSRHGYDIVDHRMLNPEIGTREEFDHMVDTLARHGMSHLCDV